MVVHLASVVLDTDACLHQKEIACDWEEDHEEEDHEEEDHEEEDHEEEDHEEEDHEEENHVAERVCQEEAVAGTEGWPDHDCNPQFLFVA